MQRICSIFLGLTIFISGIVMANARSASDAEVKMLAEATKTYTTALQAADFDAVFNAIPPRIVDKLAVQSKLAKDQFRVIMVNQMKQLATAYKVEKITIDQSKKRAGSFDDGTPYYIIPSEFIINANGTEKKRIKCELIAILDNNQWYFVRGDDATTLVTMTEAFPGFEKIKLAVPEVLPAK